MLDNVLRLFSGIEFGVTARDRRIEDIGWTLKKDYLEGIIAADFSYGSSARLSDAFSDPFPRGVLVNND
jgi:hypothetical protein